MSQFKQSAGAVYPAVYVERFLPGQGAWVQLTHWLTLPDGIERDAVGLYGVDYVPATSKDVAEFYLEALCGSDAEALGKPDRPLPPVALPVVRGRRRRGRP